MSHCARGPNRCDICKKLVKEKKICLLKVSSESQGRAMRVMEFTINDKIGFYEFDVVKIFKDEDEAKKYSEENNIAMELAISSEELTILDLDDNEISKTKE